MNRFNLAFTALAAFVVAALAAFGVAPVEASADLAVCVDWLTGWTAHTDGFAALAAPFLLGAPRLTPRFDAPADQGAETAQRTQRETPQGTVIQMTDEQFRQYMERLNRTAEPTPADVQAAAQEIANQDAQRPQRGTPPDLGADAPAARENDTRGVHWRRRVVRYFNALATKRESEERAAQMMQRVMQETRALPERQIRDEEREAEQFLANARLSHERREVGRQLLGLGEYRLLTSVEGDAQGVDNLLPAPFLAQLFVLTEEYGVARQIFRVIPYTGPGNTLSLKNLVGRVIAYWVDQGELIPPSDLEFAADTLVLNKLAGITSWTTEAQEDTVFNLIPIIQADFAEAIALKEDLAGLLGNGTATYGGFTGALRLPGVTVTRTAGTDGTVTEADLRAMKQSVSRSRRRNARWLMHESVMDAIRQLENTAGFRLFTEPPTQEGATMLLGYPVTFSEVLPAASGVEGNDVPFVGFGDFSRVLMAIKRGMTADISREAILQNSETGAILYNAYQADGALLRVTERVGFATPTSVQGAIAVLKTAEVAGD